MAFTPHFDDQGKLGPITLIRRNISERKRMEAELRESEARYRLITEHMTDVGGMASCLATEIFGDLLGAAFNEAGPSPATSPL
jgi:PAS domain-containing protein